jgi:CheY-like chemotaxis protein
MKILAVDDDIFILELLSIMSARAGFTNISTATSGMIALGMINTSDVPFDCLLIDIGMPQMDGIELCAIIRKTPGYEKTPITMLTAMAEKSYIDRAFHAGATDYANKPFDIVELHARLQKTRELITAKENETSSDVSMANSNPKSLHGHSFDLGDKIEVGGIQRLIEYNVLSNYLAQLSHSGVAMSQVVAVKIDQIKKIYAQASSAEFYYMLSEVAASITSAFVQNSSMMAYAGNGTFVVILNKEEMQPSSSLEHEIQSLVDSKIVTYDNSELMGINVSVGNPIRAGVGSRQLQTFDRAIGRVEVRSMSKNADPKNLGISLVDT